MMSNIKCISLLVAVSFLTVVGMAQKKDTITTASGMKYFLTQKGKGRLLKPGEVAVWNYKLNLTDGTKIDDSWERKSPLGEKIPSQRLIKGTSEALLLMHIGDRGIFILPPSLGYGERGFVSDGAFPGIPPFSTLVFDMELVDIKKAALLDTLEKTIFTQPVSDTSKPHTEETISLYRDLKKKKLLSDMYTSDNDLNTIGYTLLQKHPHDAIKIFLLNVEEYPEVSNVYDSLGEGYMNISDFEKAIENYEKSLALDPKNTNAVAKIKLMKEKRAKAVKTL